MRMNVWNMLSDKQRDQLLSKLRVNYKIAIENR